MKDVGEEKDERGRRERERDMVEMGRKSREVLLISVPRAPGHHDLAAWAA